MARSVGGDLGGGGASGTLGGGDGTRSRRLGPLLDDTALGLTLGGTTGAKRFRFLGGIEVI